MFSEINDKLDTITSSPVFALDSFRMPFDFMMTSAGGKVKAHQNNLNDIDNQLKDLKAKNTPKAQAKIKALNARKVEIHADMKHLQTIKPGHVVSKDFRRIPGLNNKVGRAATRVLNKGAKPINALLTKYPKIAKPYKFYARGMDTIGMASLVSPLAEMGVNTGKAVINKPKIKAASLLKTASKEEKAKIYNTCRKYPEEFCLDDKNAYKLIADRIFHQDSYIYEDKGFINGGFRPIPEVEDIKNPYYIRLVYTDPEHQGQGVAKTMIEEVIKATPSEDGYWMMVNSDNTGMQKCASKVGFSKIHQLTQNDGHITDILYKESDGE